MSRRTVVAIVASLAVHAALLWAPVGYAHPELFVARRPLNERLVYRTAVRAAGGVEQRAPEVGTASPLRLEIHRVRRIHRLAPWTQGPPPPLGVSLPDALDGLGVTHRVATAGAPLYLRAPRPRESLAESLAETLSPLVIAARQEDFPPQAAALPGWSWEPLGSRGMRVGRSAEKCVIWCPASLCAGWRAGLPAALAEWSLVIDLAAQEADGVAEAGHNTSGALGDNQ